MWSNSYDTNQMGDQNLSPVQSGNYLSPQQNSQMKQYATSLMNPQGRITSLGGGLGQLGRAMVGGYFMNQADPYTGSGSQYSPQALFSGLFGGSQ